MNYLLARLHRTWVQLLIHHNYREIAAIAVDSEIRVMYHENSDYAIGIEFHIPISAYSYIKDSDYMKKVMERAIKAVSEGHLYDPDGSPSLLSSFNYYIKLMDPEEGWQNIVRNLIANAQDPNQAAISEKAFNKAGKELLTYNEMKFASQSEIRIAQELESRKVLFFPLPLAVRAETGNFYQDHREVDFLICKDGVWGILEVSYHPNRFEQDAEKDAWFKKSGILCIQHYSAERCYNKSAKVVEEFLEILLKHKR